MRYTVTFEVYIDADNDKHALSKGELIADNQENKYGQSWDVTQLHQTPFASLNTKKVDIQKIRTEQMIKLIEEDPLPF
jgi:hypothetical protein